MTNSPTHPPAGWYPDPAGTVSERYWDGVGWSQSTRDKPAPPVPESSLAQPQSSWSEPRGSVYGQAEPVEPRRRAAFGWRLLGYMADMVIISALANLVSRYTGVTAAMDAASLRWLREMELWSAAPTDQIPVPGPDFWSAALWSTAISFGLFAAYRVIMLGLTSATVGQLMVGVRTVKLDAAPDTKLDWGTAAIRGILGALFYSLFAFINGIFGAFTSRRQTLSDMASKTEVLKIR